MDMRRCLSLRRMCFSHGCVPPALLASTAGPLAFVSCGDPVSDARIAALGPEDPGVPPGPLHRPGQPCVVCHSRQGPASPFLVAGTVYSERGSKTPLANVAVDIV